MFGGSWPTFLLTTRIWPNGCVSPRVYQLSSTERLTLVKFLKYSFLHLVVLWKPAKKFTPWWLAVRWHWYDLTARIRSFARFWTRQLLVSTAWSRRDCGYHKHVEKWRGNEQCLDAPRVESVDGTDLSNVVNFFRKKLARPCQFLSTVSEPPSNNEKKSFFVAFQWVGDAIITLTSWRLQFLPSAMVCFRF